MSTNSPVTGTSLAISTWAVLGVSALLINAIVRLAPMALEPLTAASGPSLAVLAAYLVSIVGLGYSEGYRGFQRSFAPRAAVRSRAVADAPVLIKVFAPFMAMGLIHATRRRLIAAWSLVTMVVGFILVVRLMPQPWRGAVDAGVVVGLSWGVIALLVNWWAVIQGRGPEVEADLPD